MSDRKFESVPIQHYTEERLKRRLAVMEDDLAMHVEFLHKWGSVSDLITEINSTRWLMGLPEIERGRDW